MLSSQLEIINQGQEYLKNVSSDDYNNIISPNFISAAGSHIRHIIDHYTAIIVGIDNELIDYDFRQRGSDIESSPHIAFDKLAEIKKWLTQLTQEQINQPITLITEVSVSTVNKQQVQTSVARELIFVSSHAVHHYAMIAQISLAQKNALSQSFGIAPATATFIRENGMPNISNKLQVTT